jgi:outer membrane lipoprotein-sorting protein
MFMRRKFLAIAVLGAAMLPGCGAFAASNLQGTIDKLNEAAKHFRSASADFVFDSVTTEPVPDELKQQGTVYYERDDAKFKMAAKIATEDGQPNVKIYTYTDGTFRLYQQKIDQVTVLSKANKFADYVMLGFGASGTQLQEKWTITDQGPETINGVQTEKLVLVAKDENVSKNLRSVTAWIDLSRAVSLKQVFDEGQGQTRTCTYTNIKVNQPLPGDAFTFKTDSKTQTIRQ